MNTAITVTTTGFSEAVVTLNGVAPITDGQLIFEGDDGSGAYSWRLAGQRSDASGLSEDQPSLVAQNIAWNVPVSGYVSFRVRLLRPISSSGTANLAVTLTAAAAVEPSMGPFIAALNQFSAQLMQLQGARNRLTGTFNRPVSSTGDALDVNVKYPPASADPCAGAVKGNIAISQAASARLLLGVAAKRFFVCAVTVVGADAENLSFVEGTGTTCGTSTAAVIGGTTAANGPNLAANGGFTVGMGGGTVAMQATPGNDFCLLQSGSGRVAGNLVYAVY